MPSRDACGTPDTAAGISRRHASSPLYEPGVSRLRRALSRSARASGRVGLAAQLFHIGECPRSAPRPAPFEEPPSAMTALGTHLRITCFGELRIELAGRD